MNPAMLAALQSGGVTIDPSLRLYIPFNEGVGSVAKDYSQYGNNGVLTDVEWGINGGVLNGTSSYVNCGNDPSLNITDAITVEAWVKADTIAGHRPIVCKSEHTSSGNQYELKIIDGSAAIRGSNGATTFAATKSGIIAGNWYHFTGVYSNSVLDIYVNGVIGTPATITGTKSTTTENPAIGSKRPSNPVEFFNGSIDGVRIYNRASSALEILQHYESERARYEV